MKKKMDSIRKRFGVCVLMIVVFILTGCHTAEERVSMGNVNGDEVYQDEFVYEYMETLEEFNALATGYEEAYGVDLLADGNYQEEIRKDAYDNLIRNQLFYQRAVEQGEYLSEYQQKRNSELAELYVKELEKKTKETYHITVSHVSFYLDKQSLAGIYFGTLYEKCRKEAEIMVTEESAGVTGEALEEKREAKAYELIEACYETIRKESSVTIDEELWKQIP